MQLVVHHSDFVKYLLQTIVGLVFPSGLREEFFTLLPVSLATHNYTLAIVIIAHS